ncbi:MAG TPA: MFS transporter [Jatrophihabitans sp.]|uniref:MFS transporter n=1 Tax=Jatrophihabitans sp. TaxID=1932789 RepID=UPI002DFA1F61|nr:MFS transporter [Jatrophihabitans sp.]
MPRRRHLVAALSDPGFRRLYAARLLGQFGDGVFQASLAGAVLFNPERQARAADVAAGFAVLLLPYSLLGPFAGVLLDRWWRQRVLTFANLVRAVAVVAFAGEVAAGVAGLPFYASALVLVSISRFILSALSAALPRVVPAAELVTANALSTTSGTLVAAAGGAAAVGVRLVLGDSSRDYAVIAAAAAVPFLLAGAVAAGFARGALGPLDSERRTRETVGAVLRGLLAGARHLRETRPVLLGLSAIGAHRLGYGVTTVCTVLLYRNYFSDDGFFRAGLAGLTQVVAALAAGGALAAMVTPAAFRSIGPVRWPAALLLAAAGVQLGLALTFVLPLLLVAAFLLGFVAQSIKISVDTLVQQQVEDEFRGRVFSLYDALFNVTLVVAALLTASVLPEDGHSPMAVVVIALGYAVTALAYLRLARVRSSARTSS